MPYPEIPDYHPNADDYNPPTDVQPIAGVNPYMAQLIRESLLNAGWNQSSTDWAVNNIPTALLSNSVKPRNFAGGYYPGPGEGHIEVMRDANYPNLGVTDLPYDWTVNEVIPHEMRHAYEKNYGINVPEKDYNRVLDEMGLGYRVKDYLNRNPLPGGFFSDSIQDDPAHYTSTLIEQYHMNPQDMPSWFRDSYLPEYNNPPMPR